MTWEGRGQRVIVRALAADDLPELRTAALASVERVSVWGPAGTEGLDTLVDDQGTSRLTFLVQTTDAAAIDGAPHRLAARINLNGIVGGRASWATLGYDAFDPYAGRGLLREGLALLLDHVFTPEPDGLGLHRLEAGVQPANDRSILLLRSLGFAREGFSPRLLSVPTAGDSTDAWRDHERFALLADDWRGAAHVDQIAFKPMPTRRIVCLVNGIPGAGKTTLATRLAAELGLPLLRKDSVKEAFADALAGADDLTDHTRQRSTGVGAMEAIWALLAESPCGAIVETWAPPSRDRTFVEAGLRRAGLDPTRVPEVFCAVPVSVACERYAVRAASGQRHTVHRTVSDEEWQWVAEHGIPLGLGPTLRVDTSRPVSDREVARIAVQIAASGGAQR